MIELANQANDDALRNLQICCEAIRFLRGGPKRFDSDAPKDPANLKREHHKDRKRIAVKLREEGKTFLEIGRVLNVTRQHAQVLYRRGCFLKEKGWLKI